MSHPDTQYMLIYCTPTPVGLYYYSAFPVGGERWILFSPLRPAAVWQLFSKEEEGRKIRLDFVRMSVGPDTKIKQLYPYPLPVHIYLRS